MIQNIKKNISKHRKIYLTITLTMLVILTLTLTFAYFASSIPNPAVTPAELGGSLTSYLTFQEGDPISLEHNEHNMSYGASNLSGSTTSTATLTANSAELNGGELVGSYNVIFAVNNNSFIYTTADEKPEIMLSITDPTGAEVKSITGHTYETVYDTSSGDPVSGFDITAFNGVISIVTNYEIKTTSTKVDDWTFTITYVNLDSVQNANANGTLTAMTILTSQYISSLTAGDFVTGFLTEEDGLIQHTAAIPGSANDNNYRFSGSDDVVHNYVNFNNQTWRIIGVFDGQIKLIIDSAQSSYFDNISSYSDKWEGDDLNIVSDDASSNKYYNGHFYFSMDLKSQYLIDDSKFNNGTIEFVSNMAGTLKAHDLLLQEKTSQTSSEYKIGLINPSEYYYATSSEYWNEPYYNANVLEKNLNNWIEIVGSSWATINPISSDNISITMIGPSTMGYGHVNSAFYTTPVVYLKSDAVYIRGTGTATNPFEFGLAHEYASDKILNDNGGITAISSKETPDFLVGTTSNEGMFAAPDEYGTSYYFRGAVDNNWLYFANSYWRIVRINGDNSIRLIYNGTIQPTESEAVSKNSVSYTASFNNTDENNAYVGYKYTLNQRQGNTINSNIATRLESWYNSTLINYDKYIVDNGFCYDRSLAKGGYQLDTFGYVNNNYTGYGTGTDGTTYGALARLTLNYQYPGAGGTGPILTCPTKTDYFTKYNSAVGTAVINEKAGLLSADEAVMIGFTFSSTIKLSTYINGGSFWLGTPFGFRENSGNATGSYNIYVGTLSLVSSPSNTNLVMRPVISLDPTVKLTGTGVWNDPYVVVTE